MSAAALPGTRPFNSLTTLQGALRRVLAFFKENRLFTAGVLLLLALYLFGGEVHVMEGFTAAGSLRKDDRWSVKELIDNKDKLFGDRPTGVPPFTVAL